MTRISPPDKLTSDRGLDALLDLDGTIMEVGGGNWVRIRATRVPATPERPHGIDYSLCLFSVRDERVICFDNAHSVATGSGLARRRSVARDHAHKGGKVTPYAYRDAATLLEDFWNEVEAWLREREID